MGSVTEIYIAATAGAPMEAVPSVLAEAGRGIVGDRYHAGEGTFSAKLAGRAEKEITLIEAEEVARFNAEFGHAFAAGDFRRNIVTSGVMLNDLEGREFTIGDVRLLGVRLCEPCAHLARLLTDTLLPAMVGRSGLRAQIIEGGQISIGQPVRGDSAR